MSRAETCWVDLAPMVDAGPVLSLQQVPEAEESKNRLRLDLAVTGLRPGGAAGT